MEIIIIPYYDDSKVSSKVLASSLDINSYSVGVKKESQLESVIESLKNLSDKFSTNTLVLFDNVSTHISRERLNKMVMYDYSYDIVYLFKSNERCDICRKIDMNNLAGNFISTYNVEDLNAFIITPNGKNKLISMGKMDKMTSISITPNVFYININMISDYNEYLKTQECMKPVISPYSIEYLSEKTEDINIYWILGIVILVIIIIVVIIIVYLKYRHKKKKDV